MRIDAHGLVCCLLSLTLALQPVVPWHQSLPVQDRAQPLANSPTSEGQTHDEITPLLEKLQSLADPTRLSERFEALEKLAPGESLAAFDVKTKAEALGHDTETIFAFVRDEVRYEAYPGVLRGSRGALMALAGNAFDKSLLLAALLTQHGANVRFVRGRLDADRAETLVSQMFQQAREQRDGGAPTDDDAQDLPAEFVEGSSAFAQLNIARWITSLESVDAALRTSRISVPREPPVARSTLVAEATDHCWIEVQQDGTWTALDPSFRDSEPGQSHAPATEQLGDLPIAAHQQVMIRLQLEQRRARGLESTEILQYKAKAAELHGAAVSLRHELALENSTWAATPILRINDAEVRGKKIVAAAGGLASGVDQLGGNLFNRPRGESIELGITALSLEIDFIGPNGTNETVRRELFDRIGPAARNEKRESKAPLAPLPANGLPRALVGIFAFSFSNGTLHAGLAQRQFARQLPQVRNALANSAAPKTAVPTVSAKEQTYLLADSLWLLAISFHLRSQANIQLVNSSGVWNDVLFYEATPRLAIVHFVPVDTEQGTSTAYEMKLDLRRNNLRPVAEQAGGAAIVWANVSRGLLDAALEHVMFVDAVAKTPNARNASSTIALVERARRTGVEFGVVLSQNHLFQLNMSADTKARLVDDFREPIALIAPATAIAVSDTERVGWWRVDLKSGETLAVMDTGLYEGGMQIVRSGYVQDSAELGLMHYVQAIVVVACMTVFPAVIAAWFWGEVQSQRAYRQGFNDGLNRATDSMTQRYGVPDPRDGAIDYSSHQAPNDR